MKTSKILSYVCLGALMATCLPIDLLATTDASLLDAQAIGEMDKHTDKIQSFIFGAPMRLIGVLGISGGALKAFLSGDPSPFYRYGGMGLGLIVVPFCIKAIFPVTSMLLP